MRPHDKSTRQLARRHLKLYEEVDAHIRHAKTQFDSSCRSGCAHCCYLSVAMSIPEGLVIMQHCAENPYRWAMLERLMPQFKEQAKAQANPEESRESWFAKQIPCLFLSSDNKCKVYEARPLACRTHISTDDPYKCSVEAGFGEPVRYIDLRFLDDAGWQEGLRKMKQRKLPLGFAPLPMVMLWAYCLWVKGENHFKKTLEGTPLGEGDLENMAAWVHLVRTDPKLQELQEKLDQKLKEQGIAAE